MMDSRRPRSSRISTTLRREAVWGSRVEDWRELAEEARQLKVLLREKDKEGLEEMMEFEKKRVR